MKKPRTVAALEDLGRVRLSRTFFFRNFLYSEVGNLYGVPNLPDDPELAIAAGRRLCTELLQPLFDSFGALEIRSGYRSRRVNALCHRRKHNCASNERNYARHIWDAHDQDGCAGALLRQLRGLFPAQGHDFVFRSGGVESGAESGSDVSCRHRSGQRQRLLVPV